MVRSQEFQNLLSNYMNYTISRKYFNLIDLNYLRIVELPSKKVPEYTIDYQKNIKYNLAPRQPESEETTKIFKFTPKWIPILENFRKFGLASNIDIEDILRGNETKNELDNLKRIVGTILSFKMVTPDMNLIRYNELEGKVDLIDTLYTLSEKNIGKLREEYYKDYRNFSCNLQNEKFSKIYQQIKSNGVEFEEFEDNFIFNSVQIKENKIPLLYMTTMANSILVPPLALKIMYKYLESRYKLNIGEINSKYGKPFEKKVSRKIKNLGLKIRNPKRPSKELLNIIDNQKKPTLEIDILAYDKSTLYVIDCKHVLLTYDFISGNRENIIKRKLKNIDSKQEKRIKFIKSNLKTFGFDKNKEWKFKSVIITLLKEPIESIGSSCLISEDELENIHDIPTIEC